MGKRRWVGVLLLWLWPGLGGTSEPSSADGYANKFLDNLKPRVWFEKSGAKALLDQAARQLTAARGTSIRWHIAEEKTAEAIRKLFEASDIEGIEVVFTPPLE